MMGFVEAFLEAFLIGCIAATIMDQLWRRRVEAWRRRWARMAETARQFGDERAADDLAERAHAALLIGRGNPERRARA